MSAWKELQLAIANGAEDIEEYERAWADECRRDRISDLEWNVEPTEREGE